MFFLICNFAIAAPIIVSTSVEVVEDLGLEGLHTAQRSKDAFEYLQTDWWDTLPLMRTIEDFPTYQETEIDLEGERLLQWYIDQGWRNSVVTHEVLPHDDRLFFRGPRHSEAYKVNFKVVLGENWTLTGLSVEGLTLGQQEIDVELPTLPIEWSRSIQYEITESILQQVGKEGYVNPAIHWQSRVTGNASLALEAKVDWGEVYTFGDIQILDENGMELHLLESTLSGERYNTEKVDLLHHRIEQLPSVASVTMTPFVDVVDRSVDLKFIVVPNKSRMIRGVGGLTSQATTWALDAGFQWEIRNRRSPSMVISGRHTAGYRAFPQGMDFSHDGIAMQHNIETVWAIIPQYGINLLSSGVADWDVQMGYRDELIDGQIGIRLLPNPYWTVDLTQILSRHHYGMVPSQEVMFERWFGPDGLEEDINAQATSMTVTRLKPQQSWLQLSVIPYAVMNDAPFQRFHLRSEYRKTVDRLLWRNRVEFGALRWLDENNAPQTLHERFFLGGGHSLRGWSFNKVHVPGYEGKHFDVNLGGDKAAFLSTEFQYALVSDYRILTFFDVGRVWQKWDDPMPWDEWYPSAGVGIIIPTMAGDVAFMEAVGLHRNSEILYAPSRLVFHCILVRELGE